MVKTSGKRDDAIADIGQPEKGGRVKMGRIMVRARVCVYTCLLVRVTVTGLLYEMYG